MVSVKKNNQVKTNEVINFLYDNLSPEIDKLRFIRELSHDCDSEMLKFNSEQDGAVLRGP